MEIWTIHDCLIKSLEFWEQIKRSSIHNSPKQAPVLPWAAYANFSPYTRACVCLMMTLGVRLSSLLSIKPTDVAVLENGEVRIQVQAFKHLPHDRSRASTVKCGCTQAYLDADGNPYVEKSFCLLHGLRFPVFPVDKVRICEEMRAGGYWPHSPRVTINCIGALLAQKYEEKFSFKRWYRS